MPEQITTTSPVQIIAPVPQKESGIAPRPVSKTDQDASSERQEKRGMPPSETRFERMLQEKLATQNQSVNISVDDVTKRIVVKIVDNETKKVVRQLPSEEMLRISRSLAENSFNSGKLTDVRV